MKTCRSCAELQTHCVYDAWDRCDSCRCSGVECWPPIDLSELIEKNNKLRVLRDDVDELGPTLNASHAEWKGIHSELVRRKKVWEQTRHETDKTKLLELVDQARPQEEHLKRERKRYEMLRHSLQQDIEQKQEIIQDLAHLVMDRFLQDCERCTDLQQPCDFPEDSHLCTACTTATVLCSGDGDFDHLDLIWHVAEPLTQQVDDFLLQNLDDSTDFQRLKNEEARLWSLLKPLLERSGLSLDDRQEGSRMSTKRHRIRQSIERMRSTNFRDDPGFQELLSRREVLTRCEEASMRWWSEYDVELEELTGYPVQRGLPCVDQMTEEQFHNAVAWVRAHPLYKYESSPASSPTSKASSECGGETMNIDETSGLVDVVQ